MSAPLNNRRAFRSKTNGGTSDFVGVAYRLPAEGSIDAKWRARLAEKPWHANIEWATGNKRARFATEREAAIQYDKWVIELGLDRPLNILKRKVAA